jgi:hypothetical protein
MMKSETDSIVDVGSWAKYKLGAVFYQSHTNACGKKALAARRSEKMVIKNGE